MVDYNEIVSRKAAWRFPAAHHILQAPSSDTMQGPIGFLGVQALP